MRKNITGFTLMEMVVAIVVMSILLLSVATAYRSISSGMVSNSKYSKAVNLSQMEFSKVYSISYTDATLANGYNNLTVNYDGSGYDLRRQVSYQAGSDVSIQSLKKITVSIYPSGSSTPVLSIVALRPKNIIYGF